LESEGMSYEEKELEKKKEGETSPYLGRDARHLG
jgi:hypothetical protein